MKFARRGIAENLPSKWCTQSSSPCDLLTSDPQTPEQVDDQVHVSQLQEIYLVSVQLTVSAVITQQVRAHMDLII